MQGDIFHVSRSSDGEREWYSARDAATGISIPCECKDRAASLVTSLNVAFKHHLAVALVAARGDSDTASKGPDHG